mmetsp:Transcript_27925/g.70393  ORF Transcript_27925/g.70393 Transcript_27925/m.70393 type:complete len:284 (-) Transcript_27925:26-877(-)
MQHVLVDSVVEASHKNRRVGGVRGASAVIHPPPRCHIGVVALLTVHHVALLLRLRAADLPGGDEGSVHLPHRAVLLFLVPELDETIALGHAGGCVKDDLCVPDARVVLAEVHHQLIVRHVLREVSHKQRVLGRPVLPMGHRRRPPLAPREPVARPVEAEYFARGVLGNVHPVERVQYVLRLKLRPKLHKTVPRVLPGRPLPDDLDLGHRAAHAEGCVEPVLVHPLVHVSHPQGAGTDVRRKLGSDVEGHLGLRVRHRGVPHGLGGEGLELLRVALKMLRKLHR